MPIDFKRLMIHKKLKDIPEFIAGDLTHLKEVLHPNNDPLQLGFSLAHAYLKSGESSLPHRLSHSETYYFLDGKGEIFVDNRKQIVEYGDIVFVPAFSEQYVKNTGANKLIFLCIVSPPWTPESETINNG